MRARMKPICGGRCERMRGRRFGRLSRLRAGSVVAGIVGGAVGAYFLDPARGRARRHRVRDRGAATRRRCLRAARVRATLARGRARRVVHRLRRAPAPVFDDATLVDKVESTVFRDARIPKGRISVNAEKGTVFLRGELESRELIEELERAVRAVAGVREVESLLHLPGTDAPHPRGGGLLRDVEKRGR